MAIFDQLASQLMGQSNPLDYQRQAAQQQQADIQRQQMQQQQQQQMLGAIQAKRQQDFLMQKEVADREHDKRIEDYNNRLNWGKLFSGAIEKGDPMMVKVVGGLIPAGLFDVAQGEAAAKQVQERNLLMHQFNTMTSMAEKGVPTYNRPPVDIVPQAGPTQTGEPLPSVEIPKPGISRIPYSSIVSGLPDLYYGQKPEKNGDVFGLTGNAKNQAILREIMDNPERFPPSVVTAAKEQEAANTLTPEAMNIASDLFIRSGVMPGGGMGGAKMRMQILNAVGEKAQSLGLGADDLLAAGAEYAANKSSISKLAQTQGAMDAFSRFATEQLGLLQDTLKGVTGQLTDSRLLNKPIKLWKMDVEGSPEFQVYLQQLTETRAELSRLMSTPGAANTVMPVEALREWQKVISDDASPKQQMAMIEQAKKSIALRQKSFEDARHNIREKIIKAGSPEKAAKALEGLVATPDQQPTDEAPATEGVTSSGMRYKVTQ